ncbi:hypothetical protein QQF64_022373 [Cirrhinus molitorella]|uniref:Uncharacterized protein n=1 Tax=Cirrhinus molitorella TaxID=172907 RepID=A0ABR3L9H4_9TELE
MGGIEKIIWSRCNITTIDWSDQGFGDRLKYLHKEPTLMLRYEEIVSNGPKRNEKIVVLHFYSSGLIYC